jgi:hypothetical protein
MSASLAAKVHQQSPAILKDCKMTPWRAAQFATDKVSALSLSVGTDSICRKTLSVRTNSSILVIIRDKITPPQTVRYAEVGNGLVEIIARAGLEKDPTG